jgi:hypothetical protein
MATLSVQLLKNEFATDIHDVLTFYFVIKVD